jgi:hypothetical protein
LARALDLHSRGQGFDSLILHKFLIIRGILLYIGWYDDWAKRQSKKKEKHLEISETN